MHIPILNYHLISKLPHKTYALRSLYVDPVKFNRQMLMLRMLGYQVLSIEKLMPYLLGQQQGRVVGLTFDDGYANNLHEAAPILSRYNFSATCYVVSQKIGSTNDWDLAHHAKPAPLMTRDELEQWVHLGHEIGAHGRVHADLTQLSNDDAWIEIHDAKTELETLLGLKIKSFCFPYGAYSAMHLDYVKSSKYSSCMTTRRGRYQNGDDLFQIKRIPINRYTGMAYFFTKIMTGYEDRVR
jgi:peptidoglycan/xylan/chitin deacetylase (PgdA/CDA1 family)